PHTSLGAARMGPARPLATLLAPMTSPPSAAEVGRGWLGALRRVPVGPVAVGAAMLLLAVRLVHDVGAKPYFEDEAVAGLIASRPIGELLRTVVWDRGGSPLHFLLAH